MSAIYGIWKREADLELRSASLSVSAALSMYGVDRRFEHLAADILLGGNLSATVPEDQFDQQPSGTSSGGWMVADVRLDNRNELGGKLGLATTAGLADSKLLAMAWDRWGMWCMQHLAGVFAFAVWDARRQELFVARDQTGERPLFFHKGKGFFAFASMPKGLLAIPGVHQGLNEDTLLNALTFAKSPQEVSFFKGVERLAPGHFVRVTRERVEVAAYWRPFERPMLHYTRDQEYTEHFLEVFDRVVAEQLRSIGGVGSMLSSGLDSSTITAAAALELARRGERLTSFTAVPRPEFAGGAFPGRLPDEGPGASDVAAIYPNIDHLRVHSGGLDLIEEANRLSDAIDEPVPNAVNNLWLSAILQACKARGVTTLLAGTRGNLTFSHAGLEALPQMFRRGQWARLARTVHSFRKRGMLSYRQSFGEATIGVLPEALTRKILRAGEFDLTYSAVSPRLIDEHRLRDKMLEEFYFTKYDTQRERVDLWKMYDMDLYEAGYRVLHGVDVRDPAIDRRVLEFCFAVPSEQYVVGGVHRSLVRRAMKGRLPEETLTRTRRGQQGADWYLGVRDGLPGLAAEIERTEGSATAQRMLDLPRMRTLLETFPKEQTGEMAASFAWADALCRGATFGYFMRRHERTKD